MTLGEKLLDLSAEYARSKANREEWGEDGGREPAEIGADFEAAIRELLGVTLQR